MVHDPRFNDYRESQLESEGGQVRVIAVGETSGCIVTRSHSISCKGQYGDEAMKTNTCPDCEQKLLKEDELEELQNLRKVVDQAEDCGVFEFGESLIHEDYFTDYCKEFCFSNWNIFQFYQICPD